MSLVHVSNGNARDVEMLAPLRVDSVWSDLEALTAKLGFHCWTYSAVPTCYSPLKSAFMAPVRVTTYPREHVAGCVDHDLYRSLPGVSYSVRHFGPAFFKAVRYSTPITPKLRTLLDLNRKFQVTRGVVVPLRDYFGTVGMVALAFDGTDRQLESMWRDQGKFIAQQAITINAEIQRRHAHCFTRDLLPHLTDRQREIIRLSARGLNTAQLAESLQLSVDTINKHIAAVKHRLRARTTAQTTALAAQWGLL
jgi:DNA-binding CsgD family transcriptional regulator